jgi:uncharacterized delta-60 repeat protein
MGSRSLIALALAIAALCIFAAVAFAADGDLDQSFNGDGRAIGDPTALEEAVADLVVDSQGRLVVVGFVSDSGTPSRAFIARFTPNGELDGSFSGDGWSLVQWGAEAEAAEAVTIDSKGRLVVGGYAFVAGTGFDFAAARFTGQGDLDESFSGDGRVTAHVLQGGTDLGHGVATDAEDRVLVAGQAGTRMAVARFTEAGVLDPGFGVDEGTQPMGFPSHETASGESIAIDGAGRLVVAGIAITGSQSDFGVIRLLGADGEFDSSFGFQGRATLNFGSQEGEELNDLAIDAEGRYVLVGKSGLSGSNVPLVGRLLGDGSPDSSFDGDGKAIPSLPEPSSARAVAIDPAGRVVAAGAIGNDLGQDAVLFRLDPSGALDPGFGGGGLVRDDFLAANASAEAVAIDAEGRYVVAGNATTAGNVSAIGLARFSASYPSPAAAPATDSAAAGTVQRCKGVRATKVGTAKRNVIRGTNKRDVIVALGDNDLIKGRGGNDLICAGAGKDVVKAGAGNDRVFGGGGRDRLFGEGGRDRLLGEAGKDLLRGGPGRDVER